MGAASSVLIPPGFESLSEEQKIEYQQRFSDLLATGKTEEECVAILQQEFDQLNSASSEAKEEVTEAREEVTEAKEEVTESKEEVADAPAAEATEAPVEGEAPAETEAPANADETAAGTENVENNEVAAEAAAEEAPAEAEVAAE